VRSGTFDIGEYTHATCGASANGMGLVHRSQGTVQPRRNSPVTIMCGPFRITRKFPEYDDSPNAAVTASLAQAPTTTSSPDVGTASVCTRGKAKSNRHE